ncbi:MAG: phosphate ABC transporter permease PstA [Deltaproteobacteria bacterium]|nr:phosphate ABC transporter permease PstA [Deltaproteobacteria bacterium]
MQPAQAAPMYADSSSEAAPIERAKWPISDLIFQVCALLAILLALSVIIALLFDIFSDGFHRLSWDFLTSFPSRFAAKAGIYSALVGSFCLMLLTIVFSLPLGVGAAIYLEEYAPKNRWTALLELNLANLAGVPSIIYGILALQIFVRWLDFDRSLLSGALALTLLILPVIIIASREAIRTVPRTLREASLALGATQWQTIWTQVLPVALPGIMTGCILAFSRAIGETAPLITIGALTYVAFLPDGLFSSFTALPIQAYNWVSRPQEAFHANAAAAMVVLLIILLSMNAFAILLRVKYQKRTR